MQLNSLQLECQKLGADMSLSFGCIIKHSFLHTKGMYINSIMRSRNDYIRHSILSGTDVIQIDDNIEIIGHPITYSRLCYLRHTDKKPEVIIEGVKSKLEKWINVCFAFESNPELYNKSVLERPEEMNLLVRDFLLSISQ